MPTLFVCTRACTLSVEHGRTHAGVEEFNFPAESDQAGVLVGPDACSVAVATSPPEAKSVGPSGAESTSTVRTSHPMLGRETTVLDPQASRVQTSPTISIA